MDDIYLFLRRDVNIAMHTSTAGTAKVKMIKPGKGFIGKQTNKHTKNAGKTHITVSCNSCPTGQTRTGGGIQLVSTVVHQLVQEDDGP